VEGVLDMAAFVWVNRERRYSITNSSSLQPGTVIERQRWCQLDAIDGGAARSTAFNERPKCVGLYYSACAMIDRHNTARLKNISLGIEKVATSHTQQGYCKVCDRKVTTVCSACLETAGKEMFFCTLLVIIEIASYIIK
jgi:hypothetical protein